MLCNDGLDFASRGRPTHHQRSSFFRQDRLNGPFHGSAAVTRLLYLNLKSSTCIVALTVAIEFCCPDEAKINRKKKMGPP